MKRCKTCIYRAGKPDKNGCDFYLITNRRRGCPVDDCIEYIEGEKIQLKTKFKAEVVPGRLRNKKEETV